MRSFDDLIDLASQHHGSPDLVLEKAQNSHLVDDVSRVEDYWYLSVMTRAVFSAGFAPKVVEAKWPGFEAAFMGFQPHKVAFFSDEDVDRLLNDAGIVRNGQKISATIKNARFMVDTIKTHGSFGAFLKDWPQDDQAGLLFFLAKQGARLGGATAQYFLRFSGYDAWIASSDVCAALVREEVLEKPVATTKTALKAVGAAVNTLHGQSGQPRSVISRVLALSVG